MCLRVFNDLVDFLRQFPFLDLDSSRVGLNLVRFFSHLVRKRIQGESLRTKSREGLSLLNQDILTRIGGITDQVVLKIN